MTALAKLRSQVEHARQQGTMVVLTPDEAQAVLDEHRRALNAEIRAGEREAREAALDAAAEARWQERQGRDEYGSW